MSGSGPRRTTSISSPASPSRSAACSRQAATSFFMNRPILVAKAAMSPPPRRDAVARPAAAARVLERAKQLQGSHPELLAEPDRLRRQLRVSGEQEVVDQLDRERGAEFAGLDDRVGVGADGTGG